MKKIARLGLICLTSTLLSACSTTNDKPSSPASQSAPSNGEQSSSPSDRVPSSPTTVELTLNPDGGEIEGNQNLVSFTSGQTKNLPIPKKAKFSFDGWFLESTRVTDGKGEVVAGWTPSSDTTLVARYVEAETIRLSFFYEGKEVKSKEVPLSANLKDAFVESFAIDGPYWGWYADAGATRFAETIDDLSLNSDNTAFLYAKKATGFDIQEKTIQHVDNSERTGVEIVRADSPVIPEDVDLNKLYFQGRRVDAIGDQAFLNDDKLNSLVFNEELLSIGADAFAGNSSLKKLLIPANVVSIKEHAFQKCPNLTIYCEAKSKPGKWSSDWNVTSNGINQPVTYTPAVWDSQGETGTSDGFEYTVNPSGGITITKYLNADVAMNVVVPESIAGKKVTGIGFRSFRGMEIVSAKLPDAITYIGEEAFNDTNLTSIDIPKSTVSIGDDAFYGCADLVSISLPDGLRELGFGALRSCSNLLSVVLPDGLERIESWTFQLSSKLKSVKIPSSVKAIGEDVFRACYALEKIAIPEGVTSLGDRLFDQCTSLSSVDIPDSVTSIGEYAFSQCTSLKSIKIPEGVTLIDDFAFSSCTSFTSVTLPSTVKRFGQNAFSGCAKLTSINLPEGLEKIGFNAFQNCSSLLSIVIPSSVSTIGWNAFEGCSSKMVIRCRAISQPEGWDKDWKPANIKVEFGYQG